MKLNNQMGATGTDIIIAIMIIVVTVSVISMIYVNTNLQSREITRTAGATRIATSILENIEKISYTDFCAEYTRIKNTNSNIIAIDDYTSYPSGTNTTVFNTKIPKGFTIYIYGEPNYGSYISTSDQFDLVRDIKLYITFKTGDLLKVVDFSTSKKRELINEVNAPMTSILVSQGILNSGDKKFYAVKYSENANSYIKTTEDDSDWYSYSNKKWAMVIVSTEDEENLFDLNGKLIANSSQYARYVWIPKYFYKVSDGNNVISEFAYGSLSDKAIKIDQELKANDNSTILYYNTYGNKLESSIEPTSFVLSGNRKISGKWILANSLESINSDIDGELLNNSIYGPCQIH